MKILNVIKQAIYPNHFKCACCGKEIIYNSYDFCDECLVKLPYISTKVCLRCGEPLGTLANYCMHCKNSHHEYKRNFSCFSYTSPISDLIVDYKYNNKKYLSSIFIPFMIQKYLESGITADLIIPIPLHNERLRARGFNQSELIANEFAKKLNMESSNNILVRIKNTPKQSLLSMEERKNNMENAFEVVSKDSIKGKTILIIDDVYTTGATIDECAKVLKKAKAKEVYSLTIAHAIRNKAI